MKPAFPTTEYYDEKPIGCYSGMSLRDYFAAQALTGLMDKGWQQDGTPFSADKAARTARIAYAFADAMLVERAK